MDPEALDELVKRYERGHRDPELIRNLNQAAWRSFHDPWEPSPAEPNPEETMTEDAETPDLVRTFSPEMLRRGLDTKDWRYYIRKGPDPWFVIHFVYDPIADRETKIMAAVLGRDRDILHVEWTGDRRTSADQFGLGYRLCNEWNNRFRWPRAYLDIPSLRKAAEEGELREESPSGLLSLDFNLPLGPGIHQALLNHFLDRFFDAGWEFWRMAQEDFGL